MPLQAIDHVTIRTAVPERTTEFYSKLLGMEVGPRPPFDFPGAWLYVGGRPVIHLVFVDSMSEADTGNFDHVAFVGTDFPAIRQRLVDHGIEFKENLVPASQMWQLFFPDPNDVKVEINFPPQPQR
jgi:catechol 2,3-dioxygenase-like lactoylglutathione lyase family enzyme